MPPPPLETGLSYLGSELEQVSKKKVVKLSFSKNRSTDVSFPKKGRQLFVAVNMAPPVSKFLNTPLV
jgi:hypothetical protein